MVFIQSTLSVHSIFILGMPGGMPSMKILKNSYYNTDFESNFSQKCWKN